MPGCSHPCSEMIFRTATQPPAYPSSSSSRKTWWRCIRTWRDFSTYHRCLLAKISNHKKRGTNWTMSRPIVRPQRRIYRHPWREFDARNCVILKRWPAWKKWSSMENNTSTKKPMWRTATVCCSPKAKATNRSWSKRAIAQFQQPQMNDWCNFRTMLFFISNLNKGISNIYVYT